MGCKDLQGNFSDLLLPSGPEEETMDDKIDRVFYSLACEHGLWDSDPALFVDSREEFILVYDKFAGRTANSLKQLNNR